MTFPRSPSKPVAQAGLEPRSPESYSSALGHTANLNDLLNRAAMAVSFVFKVNLVRVKGSGLRALEAGWASQGQQLSRFPPAWSPSVGQRIIELPRLI